MREIALITVKIVDETSKLQELDVQSLYTPDCTDYVAAHNMRRVEVASPVFCNSPQSDAKPVYIPVSAMTVVRVEPCNPDSALGAIIAGNEGAFVGSIVGTLGRVGVKLLDAENGNRSELDQWSRTLGGYGVDSVNMVQFYAVFSVRLIDDEVGASLEGVLRLDKIDMAIDEAIML